MLDKKDLRRFFGHLKPHRSGLILAFFCVLVGAALEPILPALLQPLLDSTVAKGGKGTGYPAWVVPVIIVALFAVRGAVGYVAQYAAAWSTKASPNAVFAGSVPYLMLAGNLMAGWQLARSLLVAQTQLAAGTDAVFMQSKITTARFYADHMLTKAPGMRDSIVKGAECVTALPLDAF